MRRHSGRVPARADASRRFRAGQMATSYVLYYHLPLQYQTTRERTMVIPSYRYGRPTLSELKWTPPSIVPHKRTQLKVSIESSLSSLTLLASASLAFYYLRFFFRNALCARSLASGQAKYGAACLPSAAHWHPGTEIEPRFSQPITTELHCTILPLC